jgi:arylsulfatase A-like enzyme
MTVPATPPPFVRPPRARWLLPACAALLWACSSPPPSRPPNVVIVVVDTLRSDRVGWYGGGRGVTPWLDRFAAERGAAVFWNAYAQGSATSPSVASLLTSRFVSQHGVATNAGTVLGESEVTIAEVLKTHGYVTGAFYGNFLLTERRGFAQGFDVARIVPSRSGVARSKPRGAEVNEAALGWVDGLANEGERRPMLLYVQYMEPHLPYTVPAEDGDRLLARRGRSPAQRELARAILADQPRQRLLAAFNPWGPDSLAIIEDLYDAEVMAVDARIGELLSGMERRGLLDHAIVVVTADHGEEFLEHERISHDAALYDETVHIPLGVVAPGAGRRDVRDVVSLVDVAPTVLELAGVPVPATFAGRSFHDLVIPRYGGWLARVFASDGDARTAFLEQDKATVRGTGNHRRALVAERRKVIEDRDGTTEFYDLETDPGERRADALGAEDRRHLLDSLRAVQAAVERNAVTPRVDDEVGEAAKERLRALGYLE